MKKEAIRKIVIGGLVLFTVSSLIGSFVYFFPQKRLQKTPSVVEKALFLINEELKRRNPSANLSVNLVGWEDVGSFYLMTFKVKNEDSQENEDYQSAVSKDGKYFFPFIINLEQRLKELSSAQTSSETQISQPQTQAQPEKRERPDVKLFVMSYCPFGLQMEKAILPVWQLLKDKADIGIYFVYYIMHGRQEMEENLRQYCIQKEEKEKFLAYLGCFVKEGKSQECLKEANVNEQKLKDCVEKTDKEFKISENFKEEGYPPFDVHKDLNEKYGVRGSPTLVINDTKVNVERSPEKVKEAICNAFLNPPKECEQKLSEETASPGFGEVKGSFGGGTCQ